MNYKNDKRIILTLDAGGTNFVFQAMQGLEPITEPVILPSLGNDLNASLKSITEGFELLKRKINKDPAAISFAFPGPADYSKGIIGDLGNLSAYRGGVPLGPLLENHFKTPVFINNDGDLFSLGESIAGFLPFINNLLIKAGSSRIYKNLIGVTIGTGLGGGIVVNNNLLLGDNSAATEIWLLRDKSNNNQNAEESVSIRGVKNFYAENCRIKFEDAPEPLEIFEIAVKKRPGNFWGGIVAYYKMGEALGEVLANVLTIIDGLIVIGGGLSGASELFLPAVVKEMNSEFELNNKKIKRLESEVFNLEDEKGLGNFLKGTEKELSFPGINKKLLYDPYKKTGVGITRIGTSKAISIGACAFALNKLEGK
jgi:glucokinase